MTNARAMSWIERWSIWEPRLVSFLHTFDPEMFILGGNIVAAGPQLIAPIQEKIARRTKILLGREVPIVFQKIVGYGGVAGAAGLVFLKQNLLTI